MDGCLQLEKVRQPYWALHTTSPSNLICNASLASNHSCSLLFVCTTAISPRPKGLMVCARRPEQIRLISEVSMKTLRLGFDTSDMELRTGRSSRYFNSAHIRFCASPTVWNESGEGPSMVPRVRELMKPVRRRIERMPRFWVVWSTAIRL